MNAAARDQSSPFLRIPDGWRVFLVVFLLAYEWLFPTIAALNNPDANALFLPRVSMQLVYVLLLCLPLIFYRREYGFLHPLILPTLYTTAKSIAALPVALIAPLQFQLFDFGVLTESSAVSLQRLTHDELATTRLEFLAVKVLALICFYAGYFAFSRARGGRVKFHRPHNLGPICFAATMFCVLVGAAFVATHGGLQAYLVAMRGGRHATLAGNGQFLDIAEFAVLPALLWYAYRPRLARNPWWLLAIAAGSLTAIVATGARSALILPLVALLLLWWRKAGRVLLVPTIALAIVATLVIGIFGSIRQDYGSQTINTSVLHPGNAEETLSIAHTEFEKRKAEESDLAGFAGAGQNELLWGRSYIGAAAFFIPRALWPSKPFNGGAYNQGVNFAGRSVADYRSGGKTHGIPMGPATEAYWNFSLPGVIVIFFLLGMFFRWLSAFVWRNAAAPAALVLAIWITLNFTGTSLSFVTTARDTIMFGILFYALGVWQPTGLTRRRAALRPASLAARPAGDP
jgi:hypothetical protein